MLHTSSLWLEDRPRGANVTLKKTRHKAKQNAHSEKALCRNNKNKRMKMQKTSHFKPVRAFLKTLKGDPLPPTQLVSLSQHIVTPPYAS